MDINRHLAAYSNVRKVMAVVKSIPNTVEAKTAIEMLCDAPLGTIGTLQSMGIFTGTKERIYA